MGYDLCVLHDDKEHFLYPQAYKNIFHQVLLWFYVFHNSNDDKDDDGSYTCMCQVILSALFIQLFT